ncbi:MAG: ABC transporter substrate-binding protein [Bacillota bacterium]|nr:ABC transporter substrate-binding protein [Bacillota bacterium]
MKRNIKVLAVLTSVLVTAGVLAGCSTKKTGTTSNNATETGDIKIGAVLPLTGSIASFGISSKEALTVLEEEINNKGGILNGRKIKFIYEDDANKQDQSTNAITKLIDSEKVVAIIGSVSSGSCLAMGPIATQKKIPMITGTATNADVTTKGGNYVFRACYLDPFQGKTAAKFASTDLKAKKAAVLYDMGSDYSKGLADAFVSSFQGAGGTVTNNLTYNTGDKDFKAQLTKIKENNVDVLFLPEYYDAVPLIAKQAKELGITATMIGGDGWDSPDLIKNGGAAVEGGYFVNHYSPDDTAQQVQDFLKAYKAKWNGKTPDALAALAYDAGKLLVDAISKAGTTDGAKVRDAVQNLNDTVVSGNITFDKDRNPVKGAVIIKIENGKQVLKTKVAAN